MFPSPCLLDARPPGAVCAMSASAQPHAHNRWQGAALLICAAPRNAEVLLESHSQLACSMQMLSGEAETAIIGGWLGVEMHACPCLTSAFWSDPCSAFGGDVCFA